MTSTGIGPPKRDTYRHGDLRRALLEAGTELARGGGPDAVVLREATRRAGVAPSAAYRHFADRRALLDAVCSAAQAALAVAMEEELDGLPNGGAPAEAARTRLRAVGAGYLRFAQAEPGLFRTAFSASDNLRSAASPSRAGAGGRRARRAPPVRARSCCGRLPRRRTTCGAPRAPPGPGRVALPPSSSWAPPSTGPSTPVSCPSSGGRAPRLR